ncbi:MAG: HNH endonuclease signature motif containing protein [Clostridiales bacterium]|nr:HNH endonuclease signature motif containing protein [Clostridiales bacterium]
MALQKYTKEWLEELCANSYSLAEVLKKAGRKPGGGNQETLKKKIAEFEINISHFTGQLWNKGKTKETDKRIAQQSANQEKYQLEEVFCLNSPVTQRVLRGYVERHNILEYKCQFCGCDGCWLNTKIALEIDHINGDNKDNRIENLRYLCPNCHATTDTYRGKNIKN